MTLSSLLSDGPMLTIHPFDPLISSQQREESTSVAVFGWCDFPAIHCGDEEDVIHHRQVNYSCWNETALAPTSPLVFNHHSLQQQQRQEEEQKEEDLTTTTNIQQSSNQEITEPPPSSPILFFQLQRDEDDDEDEEEKEEEEEESLLSTSSSSISSNNNTDSNGIEKKKDNKQKSVSFASHIEVRSYNLILGDHPLCTDGLALALDWSHGPTFHLKCPYSFNNHHHNDDQHHISTQTTRKRRGRELKLSFWERKNRLRHVTGLSESQLQRKLHLQQQQQQLYYHRQQQQQQQRRQQTAAI